MVRLRSARNVLTMRSSSEWKVTTTSRPAGFRMRSAAASASRKLGQLLVDENAQRLERPGRRMDLVRLGADHAPDDVGQRPGGVDRRILARGHDGAGDGARMPLLAELEDDVGEIALGGLRHHVGGARAFAAHPHVERAVEPEREAALGLSSCIDDTPRSSTTPSTAGWPNFSATRSSAEKRSSTSVSRPLACSTRPAPFATALWSRSMPITWALAAARMARL